MHDPFCHQVSFEKSSGVKEEVSGTVEFLKRETSGSEQVIHMFGVCCISQLSVTVTKYLNKST